ncbi:GGDEF domain-containing protein [Loktanella sp. IMCC34160]|uniref:GGDEF domain-containing protein n=1 Tax=Loktanella sp. IMCC34160 TaxID=2510646 RepID=UPI0013EB6AEB|nr:GGDEF domain-containing protein [Loktanella sp. IMCC34160]
MHRIVNRVAPKSWPDFVVKWLLFELAINLVNLTVERLVRPEAGFDPTSQILVTVIVSTPFLVFALAVMSHQYRLQCRLANLAATDLLTGLSNRGDFLERASMASVAGQGGALLLVDADHFKRINDTYGHAIGDLCLQAIAGRMRKLVRSGDIVGRFGGEEFAVFLPKATPDMARAVGERICEGVKIPVPKEGTEVQITLSVGATPVRAADSIEKMLTLADAALYRAKEMGRARIEFASIEGRAVF